MYTNISRKGNKILAVELVDGKKQIRRVDYSPVLFVETDLPSKFKNIYGKNLKPKVFDSSYDAKQFIDEFYDQIPIYGQENSIFQFIYDEYNDVTEVPSVSDLSIVHFDIEVDNEDGEFPSPFDVKYPVNLVSFFNSKTGIYTCFHTLDHNWVPTPENIDSDVIDDISAIRVVRYSSETELLMATIRYFVDNAPDILSGWNIETFDLPYLYNRCAKVINDKVFSRISPFGEVRIRTLTDDYGNDIQKLYISGVSVLDYLPLYKKFTYVNRESYKLDHIAYVELGKKKVDYSEISKLHELYRIDPQLAIDYNIVDTGLVKCLDEKLNIIAQVVDVAYLARCNFEDVFSPIKTWDAKIYNHLMNRNIVVPVSKPGTSHLIEGAYVKKPIPGMHRDIVSFDYTSLYPFVVMMWNIGPETMRLSKSLNYGNYVDDILAGEVTGDGEHSLAANGAAYTNKFESFLSILMGEVFQLRNKFKGLMKKAIECSNESDRKIYFTRQLATKILLNSLYGALGNAYFRFYDARLAESVTLSGQLAIKWIERGINEFLQAKLGDKKDRCVYIDTDSVYFTLSDVLEHFGFTEQDMHKRVDMLDKVAKVIESKAIQPAIDSMYRAVSASKNVLHMDREVIALAGFWTAKKKYALAILDNEGERYKKPKLKVMGLSLIQAKTPEWVRNKLNDALYTLILGTDEQRIPKLISSAYEDFKKLRVEEIGENLRVGGMENYDNGDGTAAKGALAHVRGSIYHNALIDKLGIKGVNKIRSGDSISYSYLIEPNPHHINVIAWDTVLPTEFELHSYVDYKAMFNKTFKKPLIDMCKKVGVQYESVSTLDAFF